MLRGRERAVPPPPSWNFAVFSKALWRRPIWWSSTFAAHSGAERRYCWASSWALLQSVCTVVRAGGWARRGIDAALYAISTRAAWGWVGHAKEKNLHDGFASCLLFFTLIYWKILTWVGRERLSEQQSHWRWISLHKWKLNNTSVPQESSARLREPTRAFRRCLRNLFLFLLSAPCEVALVLDGGC